MKSVHIAITCFFSFHLSPLSVVMFSSIQLFRLKFCINFSSLLPVLRIPHIESYNMLSSFGNGTNYVGPHYAVVSIFLLAPLSYVQIFSWGTTSFDDSILSWLKVTIYRFGLVNNFIDHLHVLITNNYNTIADSHTPNHYTPCILSLLSLVFTW
jgi:hypothetical protein